MVAAEVVGDMEDRAEAALDAGCDMVLVCNDRQSAVALLDRLGERSEPASAVRLARLHGRKPIERHALLASSEWQGARDRVSHLTDPPALELDG